MLGDPGSREAGTFRQPGSRSAVRDHLLAGSAPGPAKAALETLAVTIRGTFTV